MSDINKSYEILGLNYNASIEEVKQCYRDLVKIWHPDRFPNDRRLQDKVQEKLKEINKAYDEVCSYILYKNSKKSANDHKNKPDNNNEHQSAKKEEDFNQSNKRSYYEDNFFEFIKQYGWFILLALFFGIS